MSENKKPTYDELEESLHYAKLTLKMVNDLVMNQLPTLGAEQVTTILRDVLTGQVEILALSPPLPSGMDLFCIRKGSAIDDIVSQLAQNGAPPDLIDQVLKRLGHTEEDIRAAADEFFARMLDKMANPGIKNKTTH